MSLARDNFLSWEETFMAIANVVKLRSKDPSTQVGACLISEDNRILSVGYNGAPNGFSDENFPWGREGDFLNIKYPYVVHAERNSILNFRGNLRELKGSKIYVTLFPCNECAKEIVQVGITEIIYESIPLEETPEFKASLRILDECGIKYSQTTSHISLDIKAL